MLDEPDVIEAHLVGQADLLDGFLDDGVVVQFGTLHFVGQAEFHDVTAPFAMANDWRDCTAVPRMAGNDRILGCPSSYPVELTRR